MDRLRYKRIRECALIVKFEAYILEQTEIILPNHLYQNNRENNVTSFQTLHMVWAVLITYVKVIYSMSNSGNLLSVITKVVIPVK